MMIDRRLFLHMNWWLLGLTAMLFCFGALNLYSASTLRAEDGLILDVYFNRQMIWGGISLAAMLGFMLVDYRHFKSAGPVFYGLAVFLLVCVAVFGKTIGGSTRWLDFGLFNFQPTELAKIAVLVVGARMVSGVPERLGLWNLCKIVAMGFVPAALIAKQPDLGSALSIMLILAGIILYKGLTSTLFRVLAVLIPGVLPFGWFFLYDYQKQRILTFLDPNSDPLGAGYHVIQSQIAIGSGGFWGKGFMQGSQSQLRFLPEKHTDFAFAVFGEEWGLVGSVVMLSLFSAFLYQMYAVALEAKDEFGSCLAVGVFFYFFWQILINMGMTLGIMPVVGIPLPFISYGGSASVVNFCMIGMVLNVGMRRFVFKKN